MDYCLLRTTHRQEHHVFKIASNIWNDLEARFGNPLSSQIYRLQEQLITVFHEPNMSIAEYFTIVKSLWDEIDDLHPLLVCTCNPTTNFQKLQQDQRIMMFN